MLELNTTTTPAEDLIKDASEQTFVHDVVEMSQEIRHHRFKSSSN